jgi:DNA polymerase III epsilon subunit
MQLLLGLEEHVVFDLETTGLSSWGDEIIEIGAVKVFGEEIDDQNVFHTLVNPGRLIPPDSTAISGITNDMVANAPKFEEVFPKFMEFVGNAFLVAQNAKFDMGFITKYMVKYNVRRTWEVYDTMVFSRRAYPTETRHNLDIICQRLGLSIQKEDRHRALGDVKVTAQAFLKLRQMLGDKLPPREKWTV